MRRFNIAILAGLCVCWGAGAGAQSWGSLLQGAAEKARDAVEAQKSAPAPAPAVPASTGPTSGQSGPPSASASATGPADFTVYQNYDFVPGDQIVFDDDFRSDQEGEFPSHWKLIKGQAVVDAMQGAPVLALTQGNYAQVAPRVKVRDYLADTFTVEFDFYRKDGAYDPIVFFNSGNDYDDVQFGPKVGTGDLQGTDDQSAPYPGGEDGFNDKWHHAALIYKNGEMKCYLDQYRVLVVPDMGKLRPRWISFGGIASADAPLLIRNVRIANGGGMNLIQSLDKDGRVVTHGIHFDVNKATIRPESMGTIRQIVAALKSNPSLKLEIDGHTDSDGDAGSNQKLSEARAEAVKALLMQQGIDGARLSAKGFGASKPIAPNDTLAGKARNRRVELIKM
jgi:outer membrane protein OmpA-like peptidoglycan-associated protein